METGSRPIEALAGGLDLRTSLESGQSYLWRRDDGRMYQEGVTGADDADVESVVGDENVESVVGDEDGDGNLDDDTPWYHTVLPSTATATNEPEVLRVRQRGGRIEWEASTSNAYDRLEELLRLDDDLWAIVEATPADPLVDRAYAAHRGMRLVRDPPFACLVSFICSAQMRVSRIHEMQVALAEAYGETVAFDGREYAAFPTPDQLAAATEAELRSLSLGYRAPYVRRTAEMVADGEVDPAAARSLDYEDAREFLTRFVGVGDKVADCVLLFSLGYLEAVPLDTWIRTAIAEHYPHCDRGSYRETSRAIREQFGGEYAGYAQTYVFHHLRTG